MVTDIKEFAKTAKPSVAVVGLGGAGCNITTWIAEKGMAGGELLPQILTLITFISRKLIN